MKKRGLIIPPPMTVLRGGGIQGGGVSLRRNLIKGLLFWDEIHVPRSLGIDVGVLDDEDEERSWLQTGIFKRPIMNHGIFTDVFPNSIYAYLMQLNQRDELIWSMDGTLRFEDPPQEMVTNRVLQVTLYDALPIPSDEVNLHDLLELKEKRRDELTRLRIHLDTLYQTVAASADEELALETQLQALILAVNDYTRVINESRLPSTLISWRADLNLLAAYGRGKLMYEMTGSILMSLMASAAAFSPRVVIEPKTKGFNSGKQGEPFQYIASYTKQLDWI